MLNFKIELDESEEKIDSYSRGHISVEGSSAIVSSKVSNKNQSMIILILYLYASFSIVFVYL